MRTMLKTILAGCAALTAIGATPASGAPPHYTVDPSWPKQLPHNWIMGQVGGMDVDAQDHIWVFQRPRSLTEADRGATLTPKRAKCCVPAPSVLEFDGAGDVMQAWGGPGTVPDWPESEHAILVDNKNQVWLTGNGDKDAVLLKFSTDGKFLKQFGKIAPITNSLDTTQLGRPASVAIDPAANELFIADGYANHRVIVLDADTLGFKRMWGAYGKPPTDLKLPNFNPRSPQFANPVHCVKIANDGLVYVCDRENDRIQVFHKDGSFVKEFPVRPETRGTGTVYDIAFWPDKNQTYMIVADGADGEAVILRRDDGKEVGFFGHYGRQVGEFHNIHQIVADSRGNIYTGEVSTGMRVQKFAPDMAPAK
jgi:DNA-binding beta-propeller fold protein YncE